MTRDEIRACARQLERWHARVHVLFGRKEAQAHSLVYLRGLLSTLKRKNVEAIALRFASADGQPASEKEVVALQEFISRSPWAWQPLMEEVQAIFAEEMCTSISGRPPAVIGIIDESGFVKQGTESVGVAKQYCGRLGKTESCQVGVFLTGLSPGGTALLDHQLFLTEGWIKDRKRRKKTRVPKDVAFQTKPEIAAEMIRRTLAAGHVRFSWITGDALYGDSGKLLDGLESMNQRYILDVKSNTLVCTQDLGNRVSIFKGPKRRAREGGWRQDGVRSVREITSELPESVWHPIKLRDGGKGPVVHEFARMRVRAVRHGKPGPPIWVLFQRLLDDKSDITYRVSNAEEDISLEVMAQASGCRWRVEEFFHDGKGHLGMADYETRAWTSWHHHMSLVALAHLFVTLTRRDLKRDVPELTLDMAVRTLQASFACNELNEDAAAGLIEYHLRRNHTARESHRKSWLRKHKRQKLKVLL